MFQQLGRRIRDYPEFCVNAFTNSTPVKARACSNVCVTSPAPTVGNNSHEMMSR